MTLYRNKESKELLTFSEMIEQAAEEYTLDIDGWGKLDEYYERVQADVTPKQLQELIKHM